MSEVRKEPRLRFKNELGLDFPDWTSKPFSEIYDFLSTNSFSRDKLNYDGGLVKNIHYGDIHTKFRTQFKVQNEIVPFINPEVDLQKLKTTSFVKNGDLVIADASEDYGDIGKSIEIIDNNGEKIVCGLHTIHARKSSDEIIVGFSSFLMNSRRVRKSIMMISQGTKVLGISSKRLGEINLIFPSQTEQKKISDFLTSIDKRIELLVRKKTLLETYKKGVMKKIFNQEIRFKDNNGNDFPGWEEKSLWEITNKKSSNVSANSIEFNEGDYTIYGATGELKQVDFYEMDKPYISIVKDGSGVGRVNLCKPYSSVLGTLDIIISNESSDLNFIFQFLSKTSFLKYVTGSSIPHIYYNDYSKLKLSVPSLQEQVKISKFLSSFDTNIKLLNTQIDKSKIWKKGLLQKMFV